MGKEYDIILYGANGYTAEYIIGYLECSDLKIGLAARNISKISDTDLPKIECEITEVASKTEILINCAGPYYETAELVIKSCLKNMTHYLDLCGEVHLMKRITSTYHETAIKKKVFIVQGCGFDSIISDLGVEYLKKSFDSDIEIRSIIETKNVVVNTGTWKSLIESLSSYKKEERKSKSIKKNKEYFFDDESKGYVAKFKGTDHYMVSMTQKLMESCNLPTSQFSIYIRIGNLFNLFIYYFYLSIIALLAKYPLGKKMLLRFYSFFSHKFVEKSPLKGNVKKGSFVMKMEAVGIKNGNRISKKLCITGPDPAYTTTGICISQCALLLHEMLKKRNSRQNILNLPGGVLTPGFVFRETSFIEKVRSCGIFFNLSAD